MSWDQKKQPTLPAVDVNGTSKASIGKLVLASPEKWIGCRWSPQPAQRLRTTGRAARSGAVRS